MYEIKAYRCDYCKKYSSAKSVIRKHEPKCFDNPVNRACATCLLLEHGSEKVSERFSIEIPICRAGIKFEFVPSGLFEKKFTLKHNCPEWILDFERFDDPEKFDEPEDMKF
jgi:hypothetical protein